MAEIYCDTDIGSDSGAGTIGDPYGAAGNVIQYALDNTTQGTRGDNFHIKGTAAVNFAGTDLDFTSYTVPSIEQPVTFSGYSSAAWDTGRASINLNGASTFCGATVDGVQLHNLDISGGTGTWQVNFDNYCHIINCSVDASAGTGAIKIDNYGSVINSYLRNVSGIAIQSTLCTVKYCHIVTSSNGIRFTAGAGNASYNTIETTGGTSSYGIRCDTDGNVINNNSIFGTAVNGYGIYLISTTESAAVYNNYIEGMSGAAGYAIKIDNGGSAVLVRANRWFNCTNGLDYTAGNSGVITDNSATTASALIDPTGDDFTPTVELRGVGYPDEQNQGHTNPFLQSDIGAIQIMQRHIQRNRQ